MGEPAEPGFLLDRKWPFRIVVAVWLGVGVAAWFAADRVDRAGQVVVAGLWVVGLGLILRQFLRSLFGPVLAYDALRVGRKPRQILFRVAYALFLSLVFTWVYFTWMAFNPEARGHRVAPNVLARLANEFFQVYMVVQFILVCVLTPASVAGAIADEKERRTLEFLLATDLRDREILFGKLASRVGSLLLFLLAGLPILGLLQFFGGIDPDLVLAGFAATFATVLTLSALSIAASVLARRARDAIALTYLVAISYVLISVAFYGVVVSPALNGTAQVAGYTISSEDVAYPVVVGNPFFMVPYIVVRRAALSVDLFEALWHYLLFHGIVIAVLLAWAGLKLRPIALRQTFGSRGRSFLGRVFRKPTRAAGPQRATYREAPRGVRRAFTRPQIGEKPILWKEVFVDTGLKLGGFGRVVVIGLVVLSFVPAVMIFWFTVVDPNTFSNPGPSWWSAGRWDELGQGMNVYLRAAGTTATCLVCLAVAIRGAGVISGERDRHTLDALLTTPLAARTIVWGKFWGCLAGMRWAWAWIGALWVLALGTGGVHPVMFPAAVICLAVYASAFAWIGIFWSLHLKTTLRATMATIVSSVFLAGGYFLVFGFCCLWPLDLTRAPREIERLLVNVACGLSPPVCLGWLPIRDFDHEDMAPFGRDVPFPPFLVLGLIAWGGLAYGLSRKCMRRFRVMANRVPVPWQPPPRRGPPPLPKRST